MSSGIGSSRRTFSGAARREDHQSPAPGCDEDVHPEDPVQGEEASPLPDVSHFDEELEAG